MPTVHSTELIVCEKPNSGRFIDITGWPFGRLTVNRFAGCKVKPCSKRELFWWCKCQCGREVLVSRTNLATGDTRSCGCLRNEKSSARTRTHGEAHKTSEYRIWSLMLDRCCNRSAKAYVDYGGRGIKVCKRWLKYENFLADMGRRPSRRFSLDRLDNNGNYCPANCAWRTQKQQMRNVRSNHNVTYAGKTQCVAAWAEELELPYATLLSRLRRWTVEAAFLTPLLR